MDLSGEKRLWKLPAELFDEGCNIIGKGCGQTALTPVQLYLKRTQEGRFFFLLRTDKMVKTRVMEPSNH